MKLVQVNKVELGTVFLRLSGPNSYIADGDAHGDITNSVEAYVRLKPGIVVEEGEKYIECAVLLHDGGLSDLICRIPYRELVIY